MGYRFRERKLAVRDRETAGRERQRRERDREAEAGRQTETDKVGVRGGGLYHIIFILSNEHWFSFSFVDDQQACGLLVAYSANLNCANNGHYDPNCVKTACST